VRRQVQKELSCEFLRTKSVLALKSVHEEERIRQFVSPN
jgi:hypothetical protein